MKFMVAETTNAFASRPFSGIMGLGNSLTTLNMF
jgi:hypothetical protein